MTKDQARALCQLLHIHMGKNSYAFYATAKLFGHDIWNSTSQLEEVAWIGHRETSERMSKMAAALFRDMADALESK